MNKKIALPFFLLVSHVSLAVFAEEAVDEVVVTGTASNSGSTTNYPYGSTNTPTPSSGVNQGPNYAAAKAAEAAAAEKGKRLNACYASLAKLDKSKFACSEDGELIDVVEVTGVKAGDNSAPSLVNEPLYKESDNTRPTPPVIPKPESCNANAIALKRSACELTAKTNFGDKQDACIVAGAAVFTTSVVGGVFISLRLKDPSVTYTRNQTITIGGAGGVVGAYIGEILGNMVRDGCTGHYSAARDVDLAQCDLYEKTKTQECANYN